MKGILETIRSLGLVRVAILGALTIGVLGAFAVLGMRGSAPSRMQVLVANVDAAAGQQMATELDKAKIAYRLDAQAGQVMVAEADMQAAQQALGRAGLAAGPAEMGYEIFDKSSDMMLTDFDQQVKLTRALEGELARTITSVRGIMRARVHIVLPHRQPFERQKQEAQASVMLTLAGRGALSAEAVQSVVNLVAAGVPGLRPRNITVVDSNLHLLVQGGEGEDTRTRTAQSEELRQRMESRLTQAVELMLERSLGVGHVHAEASIRMNFDKVNETQERFDPDSSAVRSTQEVTSNNKTTDKTQGVSVQNNLPNADAAQNTTGSQEAKQEETTNYEITKTVRAVVHDQPQIERISLAVMVDGTEEAGPDGKKTWKPRPQEELDQIEKLVKSAIGYDEKRGDHVEIASMPFTSAVEVADTPPAVKAGPSNEFVSFVQIVAFGVIGLTVIIMTARSIHAMLTKPPATIRVAEMAEPGLPAPAVALPDVLPPVNPAYQTPPKALVDDSIPTMEEIDARMNPEVLKRVREVMEKYPKESAAIIRSWLNQAPEELR